MNIAHIEESVSIYGPGDRFVIWTQGCSIRCKGCWNTDMWSFEEKNEVSKERILELIREHQGAVEGVTFIGGEPLNQFNELLWLTKKIQELEMSTVVFTGFELEEIKSCNHKLLLEYLDIIIAGRYQQDQRTINHQWIGSTNQEIHFLTTRYSESIISNGNYIEIILDEYGRETLLGFPDI